MGWTSKINVWPIAYPKESKEVLFDAFWRRHNVDGLAEVIARIQIEKAKEIKINFQEHPSYYTKSSIKKYLKQIGNKNRKSKKPIKEPEMTSTWSKYLDIDINDLTRLTKEAKYMLLNWDKIQSNFFWGEVMGMEP